MANYANLKATINANIKANGAEEITGPILNNVLNAAVNALGAGWQYMGVATPATNPGTPDANVFYIAATPGTYTNFGGKVVADGEVAILKYDGSWAKEVTGAATAAQVTQLGQKVNVLNDAIFGEKTFIQDAFVFTKTIGGSTTEVGGEIDLTPQTNRPGFSYIIDACEGGDVYQIDVYGPSATAVGYAVIDANNKILSFGGSNNRITTEITIPAGGSKIVFNNYNVNLASPSVTKTSSVVSARLAAMESDIQNIEKRELYVTPQDFGAVADGVTDCRQAIEDAIASLSDGGTIFFPRGTYIINGTISLAGLKNIRFTGEYATLKKPTGDYTTMFLSSDSVNNVENVVFDHLIFDGACPDNWWSIYYDTATYPFPTNNNGCIIVEYNAINCRFEKNIVQNFSYGIHIGGAGAKNTYITDNIFIKVYNSIDTYFVGGKISGNMIDTCAAGIQIEPYDPNMSYARAKDIVICDNVVNNARYGMSIHPASCNIVISHNIVTNLQTSSDAVAFGARVCKNIVISDNVVNNGLNALKITDCVDTIISNLSLDSNSKMVYLSGGTANLVGVDGLIVNSGTTLVQTKDDVTRGILISQIGNPYRALVGMADGSYIQMESDRAKIGAYADRANIVSMEHLQVDTTYDITGLASFAIDCASLKYINTQGWDTSSIKSFADMLKRCTSLETIDVALLDVSNLVTIAGMCDSATLLRGFDVSGWHLSSALYNMHAAFAGTLIPFFDFRNSDLSGVTNMNYTFKGCTTLRWIDFRGCNLEAVTNSSATFGNCAALEKIYVKGCSEATITKVKDMVTASGLSDTIVVEEDR